ncbi:MAG: hypothetical protein ACTSQQ_10475, partial [Candidatus Helarchaeota archaeon]
RRYVLGFEEPISSALPGGELAQHAGEVKDMDTIIKDAAARTKMLKFSGLNLSPNQTEIEFKLINNSGNSLENIQIKISHVTEFFEDHKWFTNINVWYPFEELEFSYPRVKEGENEYLCEVKDVYGTIFTKKIDVKKLLAKLEKQKESK